MYCADYEVISLVEKLTVVCIINFMVTDQYNNNVTCWCRLSVDKSKSRSGLFWIQLYIHYCN